MHLSSTELKAAYAIYGGPTTERKEWYAEEVERRRAVVHSYDGATEEEGTGCSSCGRIWRAAELHSEMGGYSQFLADRALWSAAEPVPIPDTSGEPRKAWFAGDVPED